jgi:hypothetical protein
MPKKIIAIYINDMIKYFLCIYAYKPKNLPTLQGLIKVSILNFSLEVVFHFTEAADYTVLVYFHEHDEWLSL